MSKGIAILINDEGHYTWREFEGDLADLQAMVGGNIDVAPTSRQISLFVNDEGKFLDLPINRLAMDIWIPYDVHHCMIVGHDWLAGSVVFTGGVDSEGETMDLADRDRRWIMRVIRDRGGVEHG